MTRMKSRRVFNQSSQRSGESRSSGAEGMLVQPTVCRDSVLGLGCDAQERYLGSVVGFCWWE